MSYTKYIRVVFCSLFFLLSLHANAATILLAPSQADVSIGQTQKFRVLTNTQNAAINAVEGEIVFDPATVEVVSVSKSNSILNIWIEDPSFSNTTGKISFNGGVFTPGYTGSSGELFNITAKAKKAGSSIFTFQNVSIRKNDGSGTDAFSGSSNGTLVIKVAPVVPVSAPVPKVTPVLKPTVDATTTIQSNKVAPSDIRLNILAQDNISDPSILEITATDTDLKYAEIIIDNGSSTRIEFVSGSIQLALPKGIAVGSHIVQVLVYDKHQNVSEIKTVITIPDTSTIQIFTEEDEVRMGSIFALQGESTFVNEVISVFVKTPTQEIEIFETKSDVEGKFVFTTKLNEKGEYQIWAENPTGKKSEMLLATTFVTPLQKIDEFILHNRVYIRIIIGLLIIYLLSLIIGFKKKKKAPQYVGDVEQLEVESAESIKVLKQSAEKQLILLDKIAHFRNLTEDEKVLYMHCRSILR